MSFKWVVIGLYKFVQACVSFRYMFCRCHWLVAWYTCFAHTSRIFLLAVFVWMSLCCICIVQADLSMIHSFRNVVSYIHVVHAFAVSLVYTIAGFLHVAYIGLCGCCV